MFPAANSSPRLDHLSVRRNHEFNLLVGDPATGSRMREIVASDLRGETRVDSGEWHRRPFRARAAAALATFAASLLRHFAPPPGRLYIG